MWPFKKHVCDFQWRRTYFWKEGKWGYKKFCYHCGKVDETSVFYENGKDIPGNPFRFSLT